MRVDDLVNILHAMQEAGAGQDWVCIGSIPPRPLLAVFLGDESAIHLAFGMAPPPKMMHGLSGWTDPTKPIHVVDNPVENG